VSEHGLDNHGLIPNSGREFSSSLCIQTSSGAHPASCTMGTRGPFPRCKARLKCEADHSYPSSAEVKKEQQLYLLFNQLLLLCVVGPLYFTFLHQIFKLFLLFSGWTIPTQFHLVLSIQKVSWFFTLVSHLMNLNCLQSLFWVHCFWCHWQLFHWRLNWQKDVWLSCLLPFYYLYPVSALSLHTFCLNPLPLRNCNYSKCNHLASEVNVLKHFWKDTVTYDCGWHGILMFISRLLQSWKSADITKWWEFDKLALWYVHLTVKGSRWLSSIWITTTIIP
jgi:hypothetical protein